MLPYLILPIGITNSENDSKVVDARIQPREIDYYYPGFYEGAVVVTKSCSSYLVMMSVDEFDNAIKAYDHNVKSNTGKFGIMTLTPKSKLYVTD